MATKKPAAVGAVAGAKAGAKAPVKAKPKPSATGAVGGAVAGARASGKIPAPKPVAAPVVPPKDPDPTATDTSAKDILNLYLKHFGVDGLGDIVDRSIRNKVLSGTSTSAEIQMVLQDTDPWKKRFSGNEARKAAGLSPLSPDEYLSNEDAYKSTLKAFGLPAGYYDQTTDFDKFFAGGVSPDEVKRRAQAAWEWTNTADSSFKDIVHKWYGDVTLGDDSWIAAYVLDPSHTESLIERAKQAGTIGALAQKQGLSQYVDKAKTEAWLNQGLDVSGVQAGIVQASELAGSALGGIAQRFGTSYTANDALGETVDGLASAKRKRQTLSIEEQSLFSGGAGGARIQHASDGSF